MQERVVVYSVAVYLYLLMYHECESLAFSSYLALQFSGASNLKTHSLTPS